MKNDDLESKLIQKCINISCIEKGKINNHIMPFGWKNKITNWKDVLKYNLINFNTKFEMIPAKIHLYNKIFDTHSESGKTNFYKKFSKIINVSYRSNYKPQINIKNNKQYTTDCGWGCMIRSSQMILCRGLYKIFKYNLKTNDDLTKIVVPFILDNYLNINENKYIGMDNYINKLKSFGKNDIVEIDPPFSIHKICILGEKFGRTCGEWFSDFELPKIYDKINRAFNVIPNLSIIHFSNLIELKTILDRCFKEDNSNLINENNINNYVNNDNNIINENSITIEGKKYIMEKMGLIFVSNRLGIYSITSDYYPSIKNIFSCKECIGFIGGKKNTNSASYFFGYYNNNLLYIDPHRNNISVNQLDDNNINSYINKTLYKLKLTSLNAALTVGFLFRNFKEFNDLLSFFRSIQKEKNYCFYYSEQMTSKDDKELDAILNKMSSKDDF